MGKRPMNVRMNSASKTEIQSRIARDADLYVAARLRERRTMLGLTQADLAPMIGVTIIQLHKYEKGANRIAAARLFKIAQALGVGVNYFYEGLAGEQAAVTPTPRLLLQFTRAFVDIANPRERAVLCSLVKALAAGEPEPVGQQEAA
jgi:transcriptional regulator with XRE-family HTH domain